MNQESAAPAAAETVELSIGGMTCAACSGRIERQLNKLPGVEAVVNLPAERAHIRFDPAQADVDKLIATIVKTGFKICGSAALRSPAFCSFAVRKSKNTTPPLRATTSSMLLY